MEEILASIRKIITDENTAPPADGAPQDVIELTQMVQDDGSVVEVKPAAPAAPASAPQPAAQAAAPSSPPPTPEPKMNQPVDPSPSPALTSEPVVNAAASSLSSLANTVEIERLASAPATSATPLGNGARTLEDMVIELMRPLLKQWLDQNLPATVDRLVQKEIERISRKAQS